MEYPVRDIKVFIVLGIVFIIVGLVFGSLGVSYAVQETRRLIECENRSYNDPGCEPGIMWDALEPIKQEIINQAKSNK
ncbi:MAG: hypothetical protein ABII13_03565 [Patescibacteria group bacterium]|nr:hypothetical protein [Patescibacteria group bacterium]MBU2508919.1 hypothetical protein [Patescibacteria group bacterium]